MGILKIIAEGFIGFNELGSTLSDKPKFKVHADAKSVEQFLKQHRIAAKVMDYGSKGCIVVVLDERVEDVADALLEKKYG